MNIAHFHRDILSTIIDHLCTEDKYHFTLSSKYFYIVFKKTVDVHYIDNIYNPTIKYLELFNDMITKYPTEYKENGILFFKLVDIIFNFFPLFYKKEFVLTASIYHRSNHYFNQLSSYKYKPSNSQFDNICLSHKRIISIYNH